MSIDPSMMIWTLITFAVMAFLLNRFLFKPVMEHMRKRQQRIDEGRLAGQEARQLLERQQEEFQRQLEEAKTDNLRLLEAETEGVEEHRQKQRKDAAAQMDEHRKSEIIRLYMIEEKLSQSVEERSDELISVLEDNLRDLAAHPYAPVSDTDPALRGAFDELADQALARSQDGAV